MFEGADVARVASGPDKGKAIIGDPRNDENLIIQQFHLAFLKFHNKVADHFRAADPSASNAVIFGQARDLVTRHYQWIVLNDFVRRIVTQDVFDGVLGVSDLNGATAVTPNPLIFKVSSAQIPPMPLEFSAAAYRFGHTMVRDAYSWNKIFPSGTTFDFFFLFTHLSGGIGRRPIFGTNLDTFPSNWIADWRRMFAMENVPGFPPFARGSNEGGGEVPLNLATKIDTKLAQALGILSGADGIAGTGGNLAVRNLIRGSRNGLPSGQDIAAEIVAKGDRKARPLTSDELLDGLEPTIAAKVVNFDFQLKTPLWWYILREAEIGGGETLGPVGSRIVMETFFALIRASVTTIFGLPTAKSNQLSVFQPGSSPLRVGGEPITTMPHLLAFVGDVNPLG